MATKAKLKLQPGHFYKARNGAIWCCFKAKPDATSRTHDAAYCINVESGAHHPRVEYYYLDGRYDEEGKREHTLIEEVDAP